MRISFVSRSWPSHERSGVTLAAAAHVRILASAGHRISIIGSNSAVLSEQLPVERRVHVRAVGSGALYSPVRVDRSCLTMALLDTSPDIVVIEGWQTALTTAAVEVAFSLGVPILMISHGSSLHPFTSRLKDVLRSLAWEPYKRFVLPKLIAKVDVLTTLDLSASSNRFYDRELARLQEKPIFPLVNAPANWTLNFRLRNQRRPQVLVVGYFSPIKNQLVALEVAAQCPDDLQFKFVGERRGRYYELCVRRAIDLGIYNKVIFVDDSECDLADEIASSMLVFSPSLTEVLPLTLIEAMACGTPFVASPVGAVPLLRGGLHAQDVGGFRKAIKMIVNDTQLWKHFSDEGQRQHTDNYTLAHVEAQLHAAIEAALLIGTGYTDE